MNLVRMFWLRIARLFRLRKLELWLDPKLETKENIRKFMERL